MEENIDYKKAYEDLLYQVKQNISYLHEKGADGWLVTVSKGDWSWDREVILLKVF